MRTGATPQEIGSQNILLRVVPLGPVRRVIVGEEDVMEMYNHALREAWEDVEEEHRDIRIRETSMRPVEKEEVPRAQKPEKFREQDIFQPQP